MSLSVPTVKLTEVAELNPSLPAVPTFDDSVSFVPMSAVSAETAQVEHEEERRYSDVRKGYTSFVDGDLLVAKITPCFENGKIAQATLTRHVGFGSTEFHVVRPRADLIDARYLLHFLRQEYIRRQGERRMTGSAGQRRVPANFLAALDTPLPPLPEQRRIAEVLDRAEALRAKRRATLTELDVLTQAVFFEIFGNQTASAQRWGHVAFEELLLLPLRNGLSPSHSGTVRAKVLTLSAVTGSAFDAGAWKESTFHSPPPSEQSVQDDDFLICRGNGNVRLVGKGYFPSHNLPDITFPDTIIAARIDPNRVEKAFLKHVWNSKAVRTQIESVARTTNGTYKVNQSMLEGIRILAPPLALQRKFARGAQAVERMKATQRASLAEMDALFSSLQHRAFKGEL